MALPTPAEISGKHNALYENFYRTLDPQGTGIIPAADCAKFLKKSALSDAILSKIWDLSDPGGKGHLDKAGLFVSLKLITEAQSGREVTVASILNAANEEPMMGEREIVLDMSWVNVTIDEVSKFWKIFEGVVGPDGTVPGNKAKGIFLESGQSVEVLGKVWELSDTDKDGALDLFEFSIAMHILSLVAKKRIAAVPRVLPVEFLNTLKKLCNSYNNKMSSPVPPPVLPAPPILAPVVPIMPPAPLVDTWLISQEDKVKFTGLFEATDKDQDGFVSGGEIKDLFLQSGVNQQILAHIWNLCDTSQSGKLTIEQFILAMWLLQRKMNGIDPPAVLPPELVPKAAKDPESNPEFELIMKEIMELAGEKSNLENEIFLKENDKKIKTGEMKSLQSEFDTLAATLRQLENQKNVANGKLAELQSQVSTLRTQAEEQETILITQELENSSKNAEVENMAKEEQSIEQEIKQVHRTMEELEARVSDTQLEISKRKQHLVEVQELENNIKSSIVKYDAAMESGNVYSVTEPELRDLSNDFEEILVILNEIMGVVSATHSTSTPIPSTAAFDDDTFAVDAFSGGDSAFEFKVQQQQPAVDAFDDPFAALHAPTIANVASWDAAHKPVDPFAPVATAIDTKDYSPGKDPFGHEPFAAPGPALPPKGQKKPPPRPAPPKNAPARPPPPSIKKPEEDSFEADFSVFEQSKPSPWGMPLQQSNKNVVLPKPNKNMKTSKGMTSSPVPVQFQQMQQTQPEKLDFTEDPFKNYRYEDPFALSIDPFANSNNNNNNDNDPFK